MAVGERLLDCRIPGLGLGRSLTLSLSEGPRVGCYLFIEPRLHTFRLLKAGVRIVQGAGGHLGSHLWIGNRLEDRLGVTQLRSSPGALISCNSGVGDRYISNRVCYLGVARVDRIGDGNGPIGVVLLGVGVRGGIIGRLVRYGLLRLALVRRGKDPVVTDSSELFYTVRRVGQHRTVIVDGRLEEGPVLVDVGHSAARRGHRLGTVRCRGDQ